MSMNPEHGESGGATCQALVPVIITQKPARSLTAVMPRLLRCSVTEIPSGDIARTKQLGGE